MMKCLALILCAVALPAQAEPPLIEAVAARASGDKWQFDVTLSHPDNGWDHYADGWRVLTLEGTVLGLRVLAHPHDHEQPFTRSLSGVQIPKGTKQVQIQARCLIDGWGQAHTIATQP